ncbi:glycosyltransferase family 4 protein [Stieleria sp. JC731]|uniref:glycosyltransferase family 4 protein n=1 Tax=Pirellulaceae TaxID=2691357 RepID=UPI001E3DB0B9|nr:glycosyltransferase family 1 protein [Stieleria sp. JC731]MCC9601110.1 glycosyltransferase family 4 protein [Stieleria sp. JC731]
MSKNVLRLCGSVFANQKYGGVSRYLVELAKGVARRDGWGVSLGATLYCNEYLRGISSEIGHRGIYFPNRPKGLEQLNRIASQLIATISFRKPSVIHEGFFDDRNFGVNSIPRVATFYDMISERYMHDERHLNEKRRIAERADRLIAISESTKNDMVELMSVSPDKIDVIYLAADVPIVEHKSNFEFPLPFILWVGNRNGYKNFERFVQAFANTKEAKNQLCVVCAGGPTFSSDELELWSRLGLAAESLIHMRPTEETLANLYQQAAYLAYLSLYEGFGIPPLEAMLSNCPVVASRSSSIPEVVGDAAMLVDPCEIDEITVALDQLASSPERRSDYAARGLKRAQQFSWDACVDHHIKLYEQLI